MAQRGEATKNLRGVSEIWAGVRGRSAVGEEEAGLALPREAKANKSPE